MFPPPLLISKIKLNKISISSIFFVSIITKYSFIVSIYYYLYIDINMKLNILFLIL